MDGWGETEEWKEEGTSVLRLRCLESFGAVVIINFISYGFLSSLLGATGKAAWMVFVTTFYFI